LLLFNILLADLEEELGKGKGKMGKVRGEKGFSLAYADDVVLLAEEENEIRSMIERFDT